jgi:hypothetical protein
MRVLGVVDENDHYNNKVSSVTFAQRADDVSQFAERHDGDKSCNIMKARAADLSIRTDVN